MRYLLLVSLLMPHAAMAQECTKAQEVATPCGGVLLPTAWAKEGISCLSVKLPWCKADIEKLEAQKQELTAALIKANERHWYDNTLLMAGIGFALGVAASGAAILYFE